MIRIQGHVLLLLHFSKGRIGIRGSCFLKRRSGTRRGVRGVEQGKCSDQFLQYFYTVYLEGNGRSRRRFRRASGLWDNRLFCLFFPLATGGPRQFGPFIGGSFRSIESVFWLSLINPPRMVKDFHFFVPRSPTHLFLFIFWRSGEVGVLNLGLSRDTHPFLPGWFPRDWDGVSSRRRQGKVY